MGTQDEIFFCIFVLLSFFLFLFSVVSFHLSLLAKHSPVVRGLEHKRLYSVWSTSVERRQRRAVRENSCHNDLCHTRMTATNDAGCREGTGQATTVWRGKGQQITSTARTTATTSWPASSAAALPPQARSGGVVGGEGGGGEIPPFRCLWQQMLLWLTVQARRNWDRRLTKLRVCGSTNCGSSSQDWDSGTCLQGPIRQMCVSLCVFSYPGKTIVMKSFHKFSDFSTKKSLSPFF